MTKIYIDTEFNGFQGELISMALVSENGQEFYEVLECKDPTPWVAENVMPHLEKEPVTKDMFQSKLMMFLHWFEQLTIVADWPDDIKYFCESLITGPGESMYHPPIKFVLDKTLTSEDSKVPHNALHDARSIADSDITKSIETYTRSIIGDKEKSIAFLQRAGILDENGNLSENYKT